jgi:CheY-like chemotaxis protein
MTPPDNAKRILLVEPSEDLRRVLLRFLGETFRVEAVATAQQAIEILRNDRGFDLMLADLAMEPVSGLSLAETVSEQFPTVRIALTVPARFQVDQCLHGIRRQHIYQVLVKHAPFDFDEFLVDIENIFAPSKAIGIERYMLEGARIHVSELRSRQDKMQFAEEAMRFFRRYRASESELAEIRLALEEILNNAFYHAFRKSNGQEKYKLGTDVLLDLGENVTASYGCDEDCLGFSIADNAGTLDAQVFLGKLERQQSQEALMDENGRGLHLSRMVSDRMILNLRPGKLTESILLFRHRPRWGSKPILINTINP